MRFHVVGSGAREDVFVWALLKDGHEVTAAPGNPGMAARGAQCFPTVVDDILGQLKIAKDTAADATLVGPELPLQKGIVNLFRENQQSIVGPTQHAAQLETSKAFAKHFMERYGIPTAPFRIFDNSDEAKGFVKTSGKPWVVKADGLAAGKGVIVPNSVEETLDAISKIMVEKTFGSAGNTVVLEERLVGQEGSFIVLADGANAMPLKLAQDWKRRFDGDRGENTGGMGGLCPAYKNREGLEELVMEKIVRPTIDGMTAEGTPFTGFLYVGLMLTSDGPKVVEFNVRMGDPEASVTIPFVMDDFGWLMAAAAKPGGLVPGARLMQDSGYRVCVVIVSDGYPGKYESGFPISGIQEAEKTCLVFHAGTKFNSAGELATAGGRVLDVVGWGPTLETARDKVYRAVKKIHFQGASYRGDIAL